MTNGATFVRKDATQLKTWDPALYWYARAVGQMQKQSGQYANSWKFQGYFHGIPGNETAPTTVKPSNETVPPFTFEQCPHGGWFFLPWHRAYLWYFEKIVRATIKEIAAPGLGGGEPNPADTWALPYWNYARDVPPPGPGPAPTDYTTRALPAAFRSPTMPSKPFGTDQAAPNPLYLPDDVNDPDCRQFQDINDCSEYWRNPPHRAQGTNSAKEVTGYPEVNPFLAMSRTDFFAPEHTSTVPQPSFGSEDTGTAMPHIMVPGFGDLEMVPHNMIHGGVGGWMGLMVSARDPIFFLHHSNIDRLWWIWLKKGNQNPDSPGWLDRQFAFYDEKGIIQNPRCREFLDTRDYTYDDQTSGTGTPRPRPLPQRVTQVGEPVAAAVSADPPQIHSVHGPTTVGVEAPDDIGRIMRAVVTGEARETRVILTLHDVGTDVPPGTTFRVFLNDPEGKFDPDGPYFVGFISHFGMADVDGLMHKHGGHTVSFDITDNVRYLLEQGLLPDDLKDVVIVPSTPLPEPAPGKAVRDPKPRLGRVSLTAV
ncbi:tyrosinase family protein [Kitasatospora sp. SUK 42]|uniref:tyrosinase family protein n=1 Tax=Kitasatospora sp. SUK 42 TaxID=1588882 RepID=UPI0018CB4C93|nr:tyrosinase family protein [Kitasatospora sp. SUK 42]MBV2154875.1 tyrosinase family protein [Kitasatospora sp. SUK 42]